MKKNNLTEVNRNQKQAEIKVKTFPVPFSLEENQVNLTINTNTSSKPSKPSKPSKTQIINQAFKFHSQGNILEAEKTYQYYINQGFKDYRVFYNYGLLLNNLGKLKEAELYQRKAIQLKPNFANSHNNLGNILRNIGKSQEAEISYRKAIQLDPNLAEAYNNLGNTLRYFGKLQEAEISYRKAIELNSDLVDTHLNLVTTLRDLGKLQKLIILSKSLLESTSINKGYKLRASLGITIANFLKGDLSETLLSINKSNDLINQGAMNSIKDEKEKKYSFTFLRFITSLYPLLEKKKNNNPSLDKIPHVGESHCLSFAHQNLSICSRIKKIQPVLIAGGKAWHFANNQNNQWKGSLTQQIKKHNYSDEIFISFGEIDCRKDEGILNYAIKNNKDISDVCVKTVKGYLDYMETILSQNYSKRYYFGVPAPLREKQLLDDLDIKRIEIIKIYNSLLKQEVLSRSSYFLDVYALTSNDAGENNNLYMCDQTHLSPNCLPSLFEKYLYKS